MSRVSITGYECDVMVMEITKPQFNQISKNGRSSKAWESLEESLMSQTLLYGFTFDIEVINFQVQADGQDCSELAMAVFSKPPAPVVRHTIANSKGYYLVRDTWTPEACWALDFKGRFEAQKLQFLVGEVAVPDGTFRRLTAMGYNGVELPRLAPARFTDDIYLVGPDKVRRPIAAKVV